MTATQNLEAKCRRLVERGFNDSGPEGHVVREIALTLEQMHEARGQERQLEDRLTEREMDVKTRMINLTTPRNEYDFGKWATRTQMRNQLETSLVRLERHVQGLAVEREKRLHSLQDRLLALWNRREQITG